MSTCQLLASNRSLYKTRARMANLEETQRTGKFAGDWLAAKNNRYAQTARTPLVNIFLQPCGSNSRCAMAICLDEFANNQNFVPACQSACLTPQQTKWKQNLKQTKPKKKWYPIRRCWVKIECALNKHLIHLSIACMCFGSVDSMSKCNIVMI